MFMKQPCKKSSFHEDCNVFVLFNFMVILMDLACVQKTVCVIQLIIYHVNGMDKMVMPLSGIILTKTCLKLGLLINLQKDKTVHYLMSSSSPCLLFVCVCF